MNSYLKKFTIHTKNKIEFVNITEKIKNIVKESGIQDGLVLVNTMHITSSIFINDNEFGLLEDFRKWLEKLAPMDKNLYKHNLTGEDNAYAHLWRTIMGREVVLSLTDYEIDFGPWEEIFYGEFDGQRDKQVLVKVLGE